MQFKIPYGLKYQNSKSNSMMHFRFQKEGMNVASSYRIPIVDIMACYVLIIQVGKVEVSILCIVRLSFNYSGRPVIKLPPIC